MRIKYYIACAAAFLTSTTHSQTITTIAGKCDVAVYGGDGGPATDGTFRGLAGITGDKFGNVYAMDALAYRVRKISLAGTITTFAGNGTAGFSGDGGVAISAQIAASGIIAVDKIGNIYLADGNNRRVRKVDLSGIITTYAGNGSTTVSGDGGPATAAGLGNVQSICFDTSDNLYLYAANYIRKVTPAGVIIKYAGNGGGGVSGDGGLADTAQIGGGVYSMKADATGNLYFGIVGRVRKISADGYINTIAGSTGGYSGDFGPATAAKLGGGAVGVEIDSCGNIFIGDALNNVVRVVNTVGTIYTIFGTGTDGCSGDGGPASAAQFKATRILFLDKNNDLYISDDDNYTVRKIDLPRCDSLVFPVSVDAVVAEEDGLHVFPNPAEGTFTLRINTGNSTPVQVSVVNMVGAVVQQLSMQPGKDTPVNVQLPTGLYMVVAETEKGRLVEKLRVKG
jgi:trimeric autotransporter adhesin